MGKPYDEELALLSATYEWARQVSIEGLVEGIASSTAFPLIAAGSGGSLTAAHLATSLHQQYTGRPGKHMTPLELSSARDLRTSALLILSAGGANKDIQGAFRVTARREPARLIVMTCKPRSPLSDLAREYRWVDLCELDPPAGKDGFLATNSLIALSVVLARAYLSLSDSEAMLPQHLPCIARAAGSDDSCDKAWDQIWDRETLVVLHGPSTHSAALDLESKFTEAALCSVQIADYRNFGHGRHHWLAKRGSSSAVLAFVTDADRGLADRTLGALPQTIPVARVDLPLSGVAASLAAIVAALRLAGDAGRARGIDPGRPGVPAFGRKLYSLNAFGRSTTPNPKEPPAVERKLSAEGVRVPAPSHRTAWDVAYRSFLSRLQRARFRSLVFDYDGTLCDRRERFEGLGSAVGAHVNRLLTADLVVGIATGRGPSVRDALRRQIAAEHWPRLLVGYYNGAYIHLLSDEIDPEARTGPCEALREVSEALKRDPRVERLASCTHRHRQIAVETRSPAGAVPIQSIVEQLVGRWGAPGVRIVRSGHSLDVVAPAVSKMSLVGRVREHCGGADEPVLCIGDRGQWPGNDFDLLGSPHSLSVDEVSPDYGTCWNLAPPGYRGVQATQHYLRFMEIEDAHLRFDARACVRTLR